MADGDAQWAFPDATETSIRAAHAVIVATGKPGIVFLPAGTIALTAPLPVVSGIGYSGVAPTLDYLLQTVPDSGWSFTGGTVLQGDGTFAAFQANATDLGSPPTELADLSITNWLCENLGLDNFTRGISIGAVNNGGLNYSRVRNLWIRRCSDWGVFLANFQHTEVRRIWTHLCQNGQFYGALLPGATLMPGNSDFDTLMNVIPADGRDNRLCRGIVFEAGGTAARLNEMSVTRVQNNAFNRSKLSVSAGFTNTSSTITVPDGTKFAIGLPVSFTTTNYGVTLTRTYFVLSVSGNNITIGTSRTASALVATGTGSLTLESWGMPCVELSSRNSGAGVSNSHFTNVDTEGGSNAAVYVENASATSIEVSELPLSGNPIIVARAMGDCLIVSRNTAMVDYDSSCSTSAFEGRASSFPNYQPKGRWLDATRNIDVFALQGGATLLETRYSNGFFLKPGLGFGKKTVSIANGFTLGANHVGVAYYTGGAGAVTLPAIAADSGSNGTDGLAFTIVNAGTGALTINTDGTQLFNRVTAKTSIVLPAGAAIQIDGVWSSALGAGFWTALYSATLP